MLAYRVGVMAKHSNLSSDCVSLSWIKFQITLQSHIGEGAYVTVEDDTSVGWGRKAGGPLGAFRQE